MLVVVFSGTEDVSLGVWKCLESLWLLLKLLLLLLGFEDGNLMGRAIEASHSSSRSKNILRYSFVLGNLFDLVNFEIS